MAKGKNTVATGAKGMSKSPRAGKGSKAINQKLGTSSGGMGMGLKSKLEGAATVPYKGHDLGAGVKHGASGLLAGRGGRSGGGKLGA